MIDKIIDILSQNDIQNFLINEYKIDTDELFYIKKNLNQTRNKSITKYEVTIYRDFVINSVNYRGSASCTLNKSMSDEEITKCFISASEAALSVKNPYYKLPHGSSMFTTNDNLEQYELTSATNLSANDIADALFANDNHTDYFINSAEIFITSTATRIINSNGVNVSFASRIYSGEFVVQCISPSDVEIYQDFKYSSKDANIINSLKTKVINSLNMVKDRSNAIPLPANSQYDKIILEGPCVEELFYYYLRRLDASMIYPKYSSYEIGSKIVDGAKDSSDSINITLNPKVPFSNEGIALRCLELVKNNTVQYITGNARFAFYLGINPTGEYNSYKLSTGKCSLTDMKTQSYLRIVNFSDFQMDELSGQIGGEFRLAYYFDGTKEIPVTNGSISANINDIVKNIIFSKESQVSYSFEGPLAISYNKSYSLA